MYSEWELVPFEWVHISYLDETCFVLVCEIKGNWYTFRGDNSVKIVFAAFWKGVDSKKKEFTPMGANSFL